MNGVPTRCERCDRYCDGACRSRFAQIEAERGWRETRVERLRALAGRPEGLSDQQAEELDYNDGVRFGLDMALTVLRGGSIEGRRFGG